VTKNDPIEFESRVARLHNRQGAFVRRRVDVDRWVHPARVQITDLDVLTFQFGPDLSLLRTIIECKTGHSRSTPSEIDRMLWLIGLMRMSGADRAELVIMRQAPPKVREVGVELGVLVQDIADIERRENLIGIGRDQAWGSHDPAFQSHEAAIRAITKTDEELTRAYWFLRSEFWHAPSSLGLKRALTVVELISHRWANEKDAGRRRALGWLVGDALVAFSVSAVTLAARAVTMPLTEFRVQLLNRLSEGATPIGEMSRLSKAIDAYVTGLLRQYDVPPSEIVKSIGAFEPTPPEYADSLLEVLERLAERPTAARHVPLVLDLVVAYRIRRREWQLPDFKLWQVFNPAPTMALIKLMLVFLRSVVQLPPEFAGLLSERPIGGPDPLTSNQHSTSPVNSVTPLADDGTRQETLELIDSQRVNQEGSEP
jgi:hypothetical protein